MIRFTKNSSILPEPYPAAERDAAVYFWKKIKRAGA